MRRMQPRHIMLLAGLASMLAALCLPWETIIAWYYPGQYSRMVWSPLEVLWNMAASRLPGADPVLVFATSGLLPSAIVFLLYLGCVLFITRHTPRLLRDQLSASLGILLLGADAFAGFLALIGWVFLPYLYLWNEGGPSIYPTDQLIGFWLLSIGSVLAFVGVALVCAALVRIVSPARQQPAHA